MRAGGGGRGGAREWQWEMAVLSTGGEGGVRGGAVKGLEMMKGRGREGRGAECK